METPDSKTVTAATDRAKEVVEAFKILRKEDNIQENAKHLWSLANSLVADIHRGLDNTSYVDRAE